MAAERYDSNPAAGLQRARDTCADPYNVSFNDPSTHPISVRGLAAQAKEKGLYDYEGRVVLEGRGYVSVVKKVFQDGGCPHPFSWLWGDWVHDGQAKRGNKAGGQAGGVVA